MVQKIQKLFNSKIMQPKIPDENQTEQKFPGIFVQSLGIPRKFVLFFLGNEWR